MVSEYTDSPTKRLCTVMQIIVVIVVFFLLLAVVHKYAIQCNAKDFTMKHSIKKKSYTKCHQKFRRLFPGISLALKLTIY